MTQKFSNNARSALVGSLTAGATSFTIDSATADLFPVANTTDWLAPVNWFKAVIENSLGQVEIIRVGVRNAGSGLLSNVLRGQEGTIALAFSAGAVVSLRLTAADFETALAKFENVTPFMETLLDDADAGTARATLRAADASATVNLSGDQTIDGVKAFSSPIAGSVTGGASTASLAPQFDNSNKIASTAFVRRQGLQASDRIVYESSQTLTAAHAGASLVATGTAAISFTLPAANALPAGGRIYFLSFIVGANLTISRAGADFLVGNGSLSSFPSVTLMPGDTLTLESNGVSAWSLVGGSVQSLYSAGAPVGAGQIWQDVAASRALGTTYTNTSGRSIAVSVSTSSTTTGSSVGATATVSGVIVAQAAVNESAGASFAGLTQQLSFLVPPGATYSVSVASGGVINRWAELRT